MPRIELVIALGAFFSAGDEKAFFDWLQSIECVESVVGHLRNLHATLKGHPSDPQLRELIALLYRYGFDMRPLAALKSGRNAKWFAEDRNAFWHSRLFGNPKA